MNSGAGSSLIVECKSSLLTELELESVLLLESSIGSSKMVETKTLVSDDGK